MKTLASLFLGLLFILPLKAQQGFVVDHNHIDLTQIPDEYINAAKANLKIRYFRRSHGSQLDLGGMTSLTRYASFGDKYAFSKLESAKADNGVLYLSTQASNEWNSLDFENDIWVQITRDYLDDPANTDVNVVMWAWSSAFYLCSATQYINDMEMLIGEYGPGGSKIISGARTVPVTFVFQTACGQKTTERNRLVYFKNDTIREHCISHDRILFDFNDLECYDPDGNYFGDGNPDGSYTTVRKLGDDCAYLSNNPGGSVYSDRRNWGIDWMSNNPGTELTTLAGDNYCLDCAHSMGIHEGETKDNSRLHCVLKGRAAWWLWARLAGWQQTANASLSSSTQLSETNLDGAVVSISLSGNTFADDNLLVSNFQLNGAPVGLSIASVSYSGNQVATATLSFDGTDFDTNQDISITVSAAELSGNENLTSNALTVDAVDENAPSIKITTDIALSENNLNGETIHVELFNTEFADATLSTANFGLVNAPAGCLINTVNYISATTCNITLSFDNTDFDSNISNFRIGIGATELTSLNNLQSNAVTITAIIENAPYAQISTTNPLAENNLNDEFIHFKVINDTFLDENLSKSNFDLINAPAGLEIDSVDYLTDTTCNIFLIFDNTDFDENVPDFRIDVLGDELKNNQNVKSNVLVISAIAEGPVAELSANEELTESGLNGAIIYITLSEETFVTGGRDGGGFILQNAPVGLSIDTSYFTSGTEATIELAFDGTNFDSDSTNFNVFISKDMLSGANDMATNSLTIKTDVVQSVEFEQFAESIKLYPNPNDGKFSVEIGQSFKSKVNIKIINLAGAVLFERNFNVSSDDKFDFNLPNLKPGSYLFNLTSENRRFVKAFIIK